MDPLSITQRLASGEFIDRLSTALVEISHEVVRTGNAGAVSVTFKITQQAKGEPVVFIMEQIKRTPPVISPRGTMFFAVDGSLSKDDPRQPELPAFRTVETTAPMIVKVDTAERIVALDTDEDEEVS